MNRPRLVAIDDEVEFIEMLQGYFMPRGYVIDVAVRGARGVELIREKKPDIVLMDLKMPGIDGDEVLQLIRSMGLTSKVIFITAYDDEGKTKNRLLKMGAYACLDKPVSSLKHLEAVIMQVSQEKKG